ncbi:MAG: 3'(2'),5'-bisphosphate nucleotidase CysQ [Alphaproteobacteria bacterium]|nr:3'(2'),5'-bisphosphate nucleotidase CysQ [Alphaproteobacteria bacterium]
MPDNPFAQYLAPVVGLAERAGLSILYHYQKQSGALGRKSDGSPVTEADRASEAILIFGLESLTPEIPILSEEQVELGQIPDLSGGVYWCLDPLDGTKEYLQRTGEFTICIAGIAHGRAVFGLLLAPVLGLCYGSDGRGVWQFDLVNPAAAPHPISCRVRPADPSERIALVSRSHRDGKELNQLLLLEAIDEPNRRTMGSAIKFGEIAAGKADLYARFGATNQWDTAAGQAIVEAAGGTLLDHSGKPLNYSWQRFENQPFIARGKP